jgi:hypothetical protein
VILIEGASVVATIDGTSAGDDARRAAERLLAAEQPVTAG